MIYKPGTFAFIHLPRTAGCSIEKHLLRECSSHCLYSSTSLGCAVHRHISAATMESLCDDWRHIWKWCVVRNPWEVVDSAIRRGRRLAIRCGHQATGDPMIDDAWTVTPHDAVRDWFGGCCNFYAEYAAGHDIEAIPLANLNELWPMICKRCDVRHRPLGWHNIGHAHPVTWTERDVESVAIAAASDISRFGWTVPNAIWAPKVT